MERNTCSANPFSKDTFMCVKGYLAVCVLIHHLHQFTGFLNGTNLGYALTLLGHWAVVLFMFMSGYALFSSYLSKGDSYIKEFPRTRLLPFYLSYLFFVLIYTVYETIIGNPPSLAYLLRSVTLGGTIVSFGWYLQLTLFVYIIFYVFKSIFDDDDVFICALAISVAAFIIISFFLSVQKNLYEPAFVFFLGVLFAYWKNKESLHLVNKSVTFTALGLALFTVATVIGTYMVFRHSDIIEASLMYDMFYLIIMVCADAALIVFVLSFIVILKKTAPGIIVNPIGKFLGTYSLEIYVFQGLVLRILRNFISNEVLYAAVSAICVILISMPMHKLLKLMKYGFSVMLTKRSYSRLQ